jgi:hypothetical protein
MFTLTLKLRVFMAYPNLTFYTSFLISVADPDKHHFGKLDPDA